MIVFHFSESLLKFPFRIHLKATHIDSFHFWLIRFYRVYLGSGEEDLLGDPVNARGNDGEGNARENVGVVALPGVELHALVRAVRERAPASKHAASLTM